MKKFALSILFMMFFVSPVWANDTVHLHNGDKLSGEIVFYDPGQVYIQTKYGLFKIPMADVGGITSPNEQTQAQITQSLSADGKTAEVIASADGSEAALTPAPAAKTQAKKAKKVAAKPKEDEDKRYWGAKWSGNANLGAGLRTGNSETSNVNVDGTLKARWEKHRAQIFTDYNREEDDGNVTVDNQSLDLSHDFFFADKWFWANAAEFETDDIDRLDLRMILSSGLGYQPYEQDDLNLKFVFAPGYQDEEFEDGSGDSTLNFNWLTDYDQKFYDDLFRVFHNHDFSVPSDDSEAFLFQSSSGIRIPIRLGIIASGQIDFDWDNDPAAGTTEDDTTYSVKLGYEW